MMDMVAYQVRSNLDTGTAAPESTSPEQPPTLCSLVLSTSWTSRMIGDYLLGSIAPSLMREVSESLAGRAAVVELGPFSLPEIPYEKFDDLWRCGGFPEGGCSNLRTLGVALEAPRRILVHRGRLRQRGEDYELMPLEDVIREVGGG